MRFCIVGTGRSGTTLLRNLLNYHPDVFIFNETHWIPKMYEFYGTGKGSPEDLLNIIQQTYHVTGKQVTEIDQNCISKSFTQDQLITVKDFCDLVGSDFANNEGKSYWADKTPDYGPWISILHRLWPECKFVHMMRHGADVAASMSKHPGFKWMASAREDYWCPAAFNKYYQAVNIEERPLKDYGSLWYRRLKRIQNEVELLHDGSYKEFKLESFINQPEQSLKSIAEFVHISCPDNWVDEAVSKIDINRIQAREKNRNLQILGEKELKLLHELGYE